MKIYTKTGDRGTTTLIGGERVSKCDPRVDAYGTVDELSAGLALLCDTMRADGRFEEMEGLLDDIQKDLFVVEAMLAVGRKKTDGDDSSERYEGVVAPLPESAVARLERQTDRMSEELPPVGGFTIPGGHPIVSTSHICRTVCRRAERAVAGARQSFEVPEIVGTYLNRLSDWLYVVGRYAGVVLGIKELYWTPEKF